MRFAKFIFERASEVFGRRPSLSKLVLLSIVSTGGIVAYADANPGDLLVSPQTNEKKKVVVLGTGWAAISFLKNIDTSQYDVKIVSPRNYFAFTPLLPSVTCGTVEARSIVEPVRNIVNKKSGEVKFWEAECFKVDPVNKKVLCRSNIGTNMDGNGEFAVDYDYLVVAVGARVNTFNTPGVEENCHFLKEIEDAQRIRRSVMNCFEKASLPHLSEEEKKKNLHFVVIGGGPSGVEFAAELHDFVNEDLSKLYPAVKDLVRISVIEMGDHILSMFDRRITKFAEEKFQRDGIDLKTNFRVVKVSEKDITMTATKAANNGNISVPYGMAIWSTGIGTRPVIMDLMAQVGQGGRRVLATDEWLRVLGCDGVYALGDCATISQRRVMGDISAIFKVADIDNSGTLTVKEIKEVLDDICERYPQVQLYLKSYKMKNFMDLLKDSNGNAVKESKELDIEEFKKALEKVDSKVKMLPATAQVAAQQGDYLAQCFNKMKVCEEYPEGPRRMRGPGRHRFHPFRYKHLGQFAPLGGEQAAGQFPSDWVPLGSKDEAPGQLPGDWVSIGHSTQWLWYSVYASKQVSWRTRVLVVSDWMRRFIHGRDSSCI